MTLSKEVNWLQLSTQRTKLPLQESWAWHCPLDRQAPILKVSFILARTITFSKGESFHIFKAVTPVPTRMTDSSSIDWGLLESMPKNKKIGWIPAMYYSWKITLYPHGQHMQACPHGHTHTQDKHIRQQRNSPREELCTQCLLLSSIID